MVKLSKYIGLLLLITPFAAFAFVKPLKILAPEIAGVVCVEKWLCIDNVQESEKASRLYENAIKEVEGKLTPFDEKPKLVFCSTQSCFSSFGFNKEAAQSIGSFGVVISPRGWARHYIEHELIHQWQSEKFGSIKIWFAPKWVTEGMAYSLSDDPREILSEPFQGYREKYESKFNNLRGHELEVALGNEM